MRYSDWIAKLVSIGFLEELLTQEGEKALTLKTPLLIHFSAETADQISAIYDPKFEVGGVLLAKPETRGGNRILEVERVVVLKNRSPSPESSFYRPHLIENVLKIWRRNCAHNAYYVPISFHSHPRIEFDTTGDTTRLFYALSPVRTSKQDQQFSGLVRIKIGRIGFMIPSALLVQSSIGGKKTIIGFYAGGITRVDFAEYIMKLTGKTLIQIWELLSGWIKEDPNRKWILIPPLVFFLIPLILYPKQMLMMMLMVIVLLATQPVALSVQERESLPNYFGILKKEGLTIFIPNVQLE